MGPKSRKMGKAAENAASQFLHQRVGIKDIATPELDSGIDITGRYELTTSGTRREYVNFSFQVKSGRKFGPVQPGHLHEWGQLSERTPVILLHLTLPSVLEDPVIYRFLPFFRWMLNHPDWKGRTKPLTIGLSEFTTVSGDAENFRAAMLSEGRRVRKKLDAIWQTSETAQLPIDGVDLYSRFGRLSKIEVPKSALAEAASVHGPVSDQSMYEFLRDLWSSSNNSVWSPSQHPKLQKWLAALQKVPSSTLVSDEQREFSRFVQAMDAYCADRVPYEMPSFTWRELNPWRIFIQKFPASISLVHKVLEFPERWKPLQVRAAFLLASTAANSGDSKLANRAVDVLDKVQSKFQVSNVSKRAEYGNVRQFLFAHAEARGEKRIVRRCLDFLHKHPFEWDLALNRRYYESDDDLATVRSQQRKLREPRARDGNTLPLTNLLLERAIAATSEK